MNKKNTNLPDANGVLPVQGDCPLCRAGYKPTHVLVPVKDLSSGNTLMMTLPKAAYDKIEKIAEEHEPLSTELCLKREGD